MSYLVDPQIKKAQILAEYAMHRRSSLKKEVLKIIGDQSFKRIPLKKISEGPFETEDAIVNAIIEVGKYVSDNEFTQTVFGNVSCFFNDCLYISETGSRLSDLKNSISKCDLNGKSLNGLNPSSELPTHLRIAKETNSKCVLHTHPFFIIAYSLIKGKDSTMFGVPIVGGEVGGGENGIVHTVPPELKNFNIVTVYSHGVFAVDAFDFNGPFKSISDLEYLCRKRYIETYL